MFLEVTRETRRRNSSSTMFSSANLHTSRVLTAPAVFKGPRQRTLRLSAPRKSTAMAEGVRRSKKEGLEAAKAELQKFIHEKQCHPIMIRYNASCAI